MDLIRRRLGAGRLALRNIIRVVHIIRVAHVRFGLLDSLKICLSYAVLKIKMKPAKSKLKVSTGTFPGGCLVDLLKSFKSI